MRISKNFKKLMLAAIAKIKVLNKNHLKEMKELKQLK